MCVTKLNMMLKSSFCYTGKEEKSCIPVATKVRPPFLLAPTTFVVMSKGLQKVSCALHSPITLDAEQS